MSRCKGQRSDEEPPWNSFLKMAGVQCCFLIETQQAAEMSHLLKGSFTYPWDPPIISIIPKRKHFQWNSAIKKLCSHVNCFLYLAKQKKAGFTFFQADGQFAPLLTLMQTVGRSERKPLNMYEQLQKCLKKFNHHIVYLYSVSVV